jgi:hypothetical protein
MNPHFITSNDPSLVSSPHLFRENTSMLMVTDLFSQNHCRFALSFGHLKQSSMEKRQGNVFFLIFAGWRI